MENPIYVTLVVLAVLSGFFWSRFRNRVLRTVVGGDKDPRAIAERDRSGKIFLVVLVVSIIFFLTLRSLGIAR